jgi:hypothetical protein
MINISNRYTRAVLYHSETAQTIAEAVAEAYGRGATLRGANLAGANLAGANLAGANLAGADLREANLAEANLHGATLREANLAGANLAGANLHGANLHGANLAGSNLREANLAGSNLPPTCHIASLCFGSWPVTVTSTNTQIGCERHPNKSWLAWGIDAPEIAVMHPNAVAWWTRHREAVCAVIRDVMQEEQTPCSKKS